MVDKDGTGISRLGHFPYLIRLGSKIHDPLRKAEHSGRRMVANAVFSMRASDMVNASVFGIDLFETKPPRDRLRRREMKEATSGKTSNRYLKRRPTHQANRGEKRSLC